MLSDKPNRRKIVLVIVLAELAVAIVYGVIVIFSYSSYQPVSFTENEMQLYGTDGGTEAGNYTDTSFEDVRAVVTPAFKLRKGIYYIYATVYGKGTVMGGLIYDQDRNGKELYENDEFRVRPDRGKVLCRVRISEDSPLRFKVRLTGDAIDGDFIQLLNVDIVPSKSTCLYRIFCLLVFFFAADLLVWGYDKYCVYWSKKQQVICLILVLTAVFTSIPFFQEGVIAAADLEFHMQRIEGISQGLLSGQFPVRIQPGWLDGHGYPVSIFYGELFMYPSALLRIAGFTVEEAYKFYMILINGMTVVIAYYAFYKMTKEELAAMVGSVLYAGSLYRMGCLYKAQVGKCGAMAFYPLVLAGFYLLFTENVESREYKRLWGYLTAGFTGLFMTHMLSGLMAAIYAAIACLVLIKRTFRKNTLLELIKAAGMFVLLNLWLLVPFLQYMFTEKLHINASLGKPFGEGTDYYALLSNFTQDGKNLYQLVMERSSSIGYALLLVLLLYIVTMPFQDMSEILTMRSRCFFFAVLLSLWVCTKAFPVVGLARLSDAICKYFLMTQYQDRFISVAVVFAAGMGAIFFAMKVFSEKSMWFLAGVLLLVTVWQGDLYFRDAIAGEIFLDTADLNFYQGHSESYSIGNAEYLPLNVDRELLTETVSCEKGLELRSVSNEYLTYRITVTNLTGQEKNIKLPVIYYTGYRAYDRQQSTALATYAGDNGCVTVKVPGDYSGTFVMRFHEAWYWRLAEIISVITFLSILGVYYNKRKGVCYRWRLKK